MTPEAQTIQRKSSWCDDHLDCICGFANGQGGVLEIGRNDRGDAVGVADILRLLDEIPIRVQSLLGIVVNVDLRSDCGRDYLRIVVPPQPTPISYRRESPYPTADTASDVWERPDDSTRKQPENQNQPENRQKTSDRIVAFPARLPGGQPARPCCGARKHHRGQRPVSAGQAQGIREVTSCRAGQGWALDGCRKSRRGANRRGRCRRWRPPKARRDAAGPQAAHDQKTARKPPENSQKRRPTT